MNIEASSLAIDDQKIEVMGKEIPISTETIPNDTQSSLAVEKQIIEQEIEPSSLANDDKVKEKEEKNEDKVEESGEKIVS